MLLYGIVCCRVMLWYVVFWCVLLCVVICRMLLCVVVWYYGVRCGVVCCISLCVGVCVVVGGRVLVCDVVR